MSKAPIELKSLFILGSDLTISEELKQKLESRNDCLLIDDGKNGVSIEQIKQRIKDANVTIGPNTRIDINAHGKRVQGDHDDKPKTHIMRLTNTGTEYTNDILQELAAVKNPAQPIYAHLWSCHGGAANKTIHSMPKGSIIVTHVESKNSALLTNNR